MNFTDAEYSTYKLEIGDILLNEGQSLELVGRPAMYLGDPPECCFQNTLVRFRANEKIEGDFALQLFRYLMYSGQFASIATQTTSVAHLGVSRFANLRVPLPSLAEQRKIAAILGVWDEAIAAAEQLVAAQRERKRGLMQRLLTGRMRFPEFQSALWKEQKFGSFLRESRIPGSNGALAKKLSIKLYGKGVQAKADGQPGSEDTRYYRRRAGQFIYSKLDFLNGAFGIVPAELDGYESTLDLPTFDIAREINSAFLLAYVTRESFYKSHLGKARGGRKARRVPPDEFLSIMLPLPSREEQDRIAEVLAACNLEISAAEQHLALLRQQKRGLMQRLLTGQVRVNTLTDSQILPDGIAASSQHE